MTWRTIFRSALFAGIPLLLLVGWVYLWASSHSVDTVQQNDTLALLQEMKQFDSTWSADVLRSHADVNPNYDALTVPLQHLEHGLARLRDRAESLPQADIKMSVDALANAVDQKAELIDAFKAQNSLFKNSLRYVPTAYEDIRPGPHASNHLSVGIEAKLEYLVNQTLRYSAVPGGEATDALLAEITEVGKSTDSLPAAVREPFQNLLSHLKTLLSLRSRQTSLLRSIFAVDVAAKADAVAGNFGQLYSDELASQFRAQRLLLAYSAFSLMLVIAGTAFIGYRNATERRRLRKLVDEKTLELNDLATRDELTRVFNRRHASELLRQMLAYHARSSEPMCVALLDIDHFKKINDTRGHAAGDKVLARFAAIAGRTLRTVDLLGRWGGEEFLIALPNTSLECAEVALERVRNALLHTDFTDVGDVLKVTFSCGLVLVPAGGTVAAVVERADRAMYRAKASGRDTVEIG